MIGRVDYLHKIYIFVLDFFFFFHIFSFFFHTIDAGNTLLLLIIIIYYLNDYTYGVGWKISRTNRFIKNYNLKSRSFHVTTNVSDELRHFLTVGSTYAELFHKLENSICLVPTRFQQLCVFPRHCINHHTF